jgi:hypothetical protein
MTAQCSIQLVELPRYLSRGHVRLGCREKCLLSIVRAKARCEEIVFFENSEQDKP